MKKSLEKKCNHYPMIGMSSEVKFGGCWEILERDMRHITRRCIKCGQVEISYLTSYKPEMFMSEGAKWKVNKMREEHAVDMLQPIDQKTGKFNEDFGKHYGYNPLKTPAPHVNKPDDKLDKQMANEQVNEEHINLNKL